MRNRLKSIVIAAGLLAASVSQAAAHTLADTMVLAYRNSGVLDQNRALLRAADEDVAQAVASLRPILSWTGTAAYQYREVTQQIAGGSSTTIVQEGASATLELTASMTLYDFGRTQYAIDAAKENVLATRQALIGAEQNILLQAVQAHLGVQRASESLALRQSNIRVVTRELRAVEDRFELGEVTRTDIDAAKARVALARSQLVAAQGDLAQAREAYRAVTGEFPNSLTPAGPAAVTRNLADAKSYAARYHPSAVQQRHAVAAAELNVLRAQTAAKPTVSGQGRLGIDQDFNRGASLSVTIGGPIYQGGALSSQVRQAMARRDAARAGLYQVARGIEQQVGNAYASYQVTAQILEASGQQVRAARSAYRGLQEEAGLGSRTTLDVLGAEQRLLDAQVSQISTRIDRVLASYNVLASMGLLTATHLNLPVKQYDPTAYYRLAETAPTAGSAQGRALDRVLQSIGD